MMAVAGYAKELLIMQETCSIPVIVNYTGIASGSGWPR